MTSKPLLVLMADCFPLLCCLSCRSGARLKQIGTFLMHHPHNPFQREMVIMYRAEILLFASTCECRIGPRCLQSKKPVQAYQIVVWTADISLTFTATAPLWAICHKFLPFSRFAAPTVSSIATIFGLRSGLSLLCCLSRVGLPGASLWHFTSITAPNGCHIYQFICFIWQHDKHYGQMALNM